MGGEEADGVVAPVVGEAPLDQKRLGHALVHGQQLDRGHPQVDQVGDGGLVGQARVGAPQLGREPRVGHREALDVDLVDDRVGVGVVRAGAVGPREGRVDHEAAGHVAGRVERARRLGVVGVVAEHLGTEPHGPGRGPGVGVEQQLGRVAAHPAGGVVGAGRPVAVGLTGTHPRHEAVPDAGVVVDATGSGSRRRRVEQAQHHAVGDPGRHREVGAARSGVAPSGNGRPGQYLGRRLLSVVTAVPSGRRRRASGRRRPGPRRRDGA